MGNTETAFNTDFAALIIDIRIKRKSGEVGPFSGFIRDQFTVTLSCFMSVGTPAVFDHGLLCFHSPYRVRLLFLQSNSFY